jgi:hypothetical protein
LRGLPGSVGASRSPSSRQKVTFVETAIGAPEAPPLVTHASYADRVHSW